MEALPDEALEADPLHHEIPFATVEVAGPEAVAVSRVPPIPPPYPRYDLGRRYTRPGIITAIGVSSIVVAAICMLGGGVMILVNLVVSSVSRFPTPAIAAPVVVTPPAPGPAELVGANGTTAADRATIIEGLGRVQLLTALERDQLDELLAEEGKTVLPLGADFTPEQVVANVTRSGHLSTGGAAGSEYFVLGTGRLEVGEDRAIFFPPNGQPSVRSNAISIPAGPSGVLTPDQIRSVIRAINRQNGSRIKSAQVSAIIQILQGPGQQLVAAANDGSDPATQITSVTTDRDDGSLKVATAHAGTTSDITVTAAGQVTSSSTMSTTLNGSATSTSVTSFGGSGSTRPGFDKSTSQWAMFLTGLQLALAVYLLICGIFMLREGGHLGRRMHLIYLGLKLPVGIAAAVVSYQLWAGFEASNASNGAPPSLPIGFMLPAAIGLIYPVVLLPVLLASRGVRDYFSAARYAA